MLADVLAPCQARPDVGMVINSGAISLNEPAACPGLPGSTTSPSCSSAHTTEPARQKVSAACGASWARAAGPGDPGWALPSPRPETAGADAGRALNWLPDRSRGSMPGHGASSSRAQGEQRIPPAQKLAVPARPRPTANPCKNIARRKCAAPGGGASALRFSPFHLATPCRFSQPPVRAPSNCLPPSTTTRVPTTTRCGPRLCATQRAFGRGGGAVLRRGCR